MKLITRDTDYAVRALCYMAKHKKNIVPVSELVKNLGIPHSFLRKILQILNKKKILKSYKGKGGGFILNISPDKIFLVDLIKIFQGKIRLNKCIFKKRVCPDIRTCRLKEKINRIQKYVISELENITLASLLDK